MNRRITPLLLGLNLLLALALALLWLGPGSSIEWKPPAAQPPNLDDAYAAQLSPRPGIAAEFSQIAARPVFSSSRRPAPAASAASGAEAPPPPPVALDKLKMLGTIDGPTLRGVLAEVEGESRFIRNGEKVGEWTLRSISSSEATFQKDDEKRVIPLPLAKGGEPSKPHAAAPRAGRPAAPSKAAPAPAARPKPASPAASPDDEKPRRRGGWGP